MLRRRSVAIPFNEQLGVHEQAENFTRHQEWDFAHTAPGELLLKKQQWKQLSKDLETLKQLPAAPPATTAALIPQP